MNRTACGLLGLCVVGGLACASPPEPKRISAPGLVPTEQLPGELLARHRFAYRFGEREGALEAVLQVHCGEVVVLGLGPMSSPLFSIRQRGDAIEAWSQRPWPLPAARILLDAHRIFLYPVADPPLADGVHALRVAKVAFEERWAGGRLVERAIPGGDVRGVRIRFQEGADARSGPGPTTLVDDRLGYRLDIEPRQYRRTTCDEDERALLTTPQSRLAEIRSPAPRPGSA